MKTGDLVKYWKGVKQGPPSGVGQIYEIGEVAKVKVAWIKGVTGCIAITHCEPVEKL